jgi:hypothetical protein
MRRIPLILGLVLIAGLIIHDIYEFFVTNEGIRYFSSEPGRLLYVMLLGVAGGIVALGISRLSPASQRSLKLLALGGFGIFLVGAIPVFGYLLCLLGAGPIAWGVGMWGCIVAGFVAVAVSAWLVWLEFRQVWRQTR